MKLGINATDIAEKYGYKPIHGRICCPFHPDRHPSLQLYNDTESYYCFGCNTSGDMVGFVSRLLEIPFKEAVERICTDFRIENPCQRTRRPRHRRSDARPLSKFEAAKQLSEAINEYEKITVSLEDYVNSQIMYMHEHDNNESIDTLHWVIEYSENYYTTEKTKAYEKLQSAIHAANRAFCLSYTNPHKLLQRVGKDLSKELEKQQLTPYCDSS
jgi:hypothetical protein